MSDIDKIFNIIYAQTNTVPRVIIERLDYGELTSAINFSQNYVMRIYAAIYFDIKDRLRRISTAVERESEQLIEQ